MKFIFRDQEMCRSALRILNMLEFCGDSDRAAAHRARMEISKQRVISHRDFWHFNETHVPSLR